MDQWETVTRSEEQERLQRVLEVISGDVMPPEDAETLPPHVKSGLIDQLQDRLDELAAGARQSGLWPRNRRLTVAEYNHTMQDLWGVEDGGLSKLSPKD